MFRGEVNSPLAAAAVMQSILSQAEEGADMFSRKLPPADTHRHRGEQLAPFALEAQCAGVVK